jgi:hypothetical protein
MRQTIENYKGDGRYRHAGQLAAITGEPEPIYGCHYGMRSTRDAAVEEYRAGFFEASVLAASDAPARLTRAPRAAI